MTRSDARPRLPSGPVAEWAGEVQRAHAVGPCAECGPQGCRRCADARLLMLVARRRFDRSGRRQGMVGDRLELAAALRAKGLLWTDVAAVLRSRYRVTGMVAMRLAHGWAQREVAELWSARWPDEVKTFKTISYWECWPGAAGHAPSLGALGRLAELYECAVSDLVEGLGDFRHLDVERPDEGGALFSCCVFCQATKLNPACL